MNWSNIKKQLLSHYDSDKDIIIAPKRTLGYYHEERHRWQKERKYLDAITWSYYVFAPWAILTWNVVPIMVHYGLIVGLEADAWWYALEKRKRTI